MLEGKLIVIPALGHENKETWTSEAWLAFVFMSQCGNNNELALQLKGLGEFSTVVQTRDEVEGLHKCLEFSQPLSCLYQAMQTRKTFSIA